MYITILIAHYAFKINLSLSFRGRFELFHSIEHYELRITNYLISLPSTVMGIG